jgi:hypothetical protein
MAHISLVKSGVEIDAARLGEWLGIAAVEVMNRIRDGAITSRYEKGLDEDEGRHRITFFTQNCRLRVVVDQDGSVLRKDRIDFGRRPLASALRRPP